MFSNTKCSHFERERGQGTKSQSSTCVLNMGNGTYTKQGRPRDVNLCEALRTNSTWWAGGKNLVSDWWTRELPFTAGSNVSPSPPRSGRKGEGVLVLSFSQRVGRGGGSGSQLPESLRPFLGRNKLTKKIYEEAYRASALALCLHQVFNKPLVNKWRNK